MICPCCESHAVSDYMAFERFPEFQFPLPKALLGKIHGVPFELAICKGCGYLLHRNPDPELLEKIYLEYYAYYNLSSSEQMAKVYNPVFRKFVDPFLKRAGHSSLLEIGCGEASNFDFISGYGMSYYGIDPSDNIERAMAKHGSQRFKQAFFSQNLFDEKFGVILSQFSLEHSLDISKFFNDIVTYASKGTILIIEVPNAAYYMENRLPFFFAYEHISYFNPVCLKALFQKYGFRLLDVYHQGHPSIIVAGEYVGPMVTDLIETKASPCSADLQNKYLQASRTLQASVAEFFSKEKLFCFYGVGLIYYWFRLVLENHRDNFQVVDDNEFYNGKYTPFFQDQVMKPCAQVLIPYDTIILSVNPTYYDAVIANLKRIKPSDFKIIYVEGGKLISKMVTP